MSKVTAEQLRSVLGRVPTSVSIVTLASQAGAIGGIVSTMNSVSLKPPLISFCVAHHSQIRLLATQEGAWVGVSVLAADQRGVSSSVLSQSTALLRDDVAWSPGLHGLPRLDGALAWIACRIDRVQPVGNHDLVIAEIEELELLREGAEPMLSSVADVRSSFWADAAGAAPA